MNKDYALSFDDILLVPQYSSIKSRKDISIDMHGFTLPIVSAPMDTVTEWEMASVIAENGGMGFIHRYMSKEDRISQIKKAFQKTCKAGVGVAVSTEECFDYDFISKVINSGCLWFCVDTANGHNQLAIDAVRSLSDRYPLINIMAGNVATAEGFVALSDAGATAIRVGIGGGSVCTTRIVTGHGMPTLQSIIDCAEVKKNNDISTLIVADGGIKTTGHIAKAFAAGADLVMLGGYLAGTEEASGELVDGFKAFRGMASAEAQMDWRGNVSVNEGASTKIKYKGSVTVLLDDIVGGLRSACSYTGIDKLSELYDSATYIVVSPNAMSENIPHALVN